MEKNLSWSNWKSLLLWCMFFFKWGVVIVVKGASLNDISGILNVPIQWKQQTIPFYTSGNCVTNTGGTSWIVGGKTKGVNNDVSNMAQKMQFMEQSYTHLISNEVMQLPGSFPGQYLDSPGMFCTVSAQAVYNNITKRFCYLGANDGSSNAPQCGCCSVEIGSNSKIKCTDMDVLGMCPPLFQSCVINDDSKKRGIQIGGTSGVVSLKNILCFDTTSESYTKKITTYSDLTTEATTNDPNCEYGNLQHSAYDMGCDLMPNDYDHSIIVVGGRTTDKLKDSSFLDTVQICKNNGQTCQTLTNLVLPIGLSGVRVIGLTNCIFIAFGGVDPSGSANGKVYVGDICGQQWLHTENLPLALSEFSVILGVDSLCLYGGMVSRQLQNIAYCTKFTRNPNTYTTTTSGPSSTSTSVSTTESTPSPTPGLTPSPNPGSNTPSPNPGSNTPSPNPGSTPTPKPGTTLDSDTETTTLNPESTANIDSESGSESRSNRTTKKNFLSSNLYLIILIAVLVSVVIILCCIWRRCVAKKQGTSAVGIKKMLVKSWSVLSARSTTNVSSEAEKSMGVVVMTSTTRVPSRKHPLDNTDTQIVCTDGTNV